MGRPVCIFPISNALLLAVARIAGRTDLIERLFGSLQVDTAKVTRLLNWRPLIPLEER